MLTLLEFVAYCLIAASYWEACWKCFLAELAAAPLVDHAEF